MEANDNTPLATNEEQVPKEDPQKGQPDYSLRQVTLLAVVCAVMGLISGAVINDRIGALDFSNDRTQDTDSDRFAGYDEYYGKYEGTYAPAPLDSSVDPIGIPAGSNYKIQYNSVYYESEDGSDVYVMPHTETFEYLSEEFVKNDSVVYYRDQAQQWVNPDKCTLENLSGCREDRGWESLVSPYQLEVSWSGNAIQAEDLIPEFAPLCLSEGYKVGEVSNGLLAGYPLLVQMDEICDMWCGGLAILGAHHYVKYGDYTIPVAGATGFDIKDIATSTRTERIPIPNSATALLSRGTFGLSGVESSDNRAYLFTDPVVSDIYRDDYACFVSTRPDQVEVAYTLELPFTYSRDNGEMPFIKLDGTTNEEVYKAYRDYGSCLSIVDGSEISEDKLTKAGEFATGVEIYEWKNPSEMKLLELYNNPNTLASYQDGKNKYTYDEFLQYKPYLYWKDPFGDWVELLNKRFDVAAEKCKPVIYLYPESEGEFTVEVEPNGGFTETIPEYHDGWRVVSTPDSVITDTRTGESYPYLYWEGINTGIPDITEGWVVDTANIEVFLKEKLARLGLSEKEIADFNEYWVARLQAEESEKFKVMFVPQVMFDELAPLTVAGDEEPETVIRVMMYAQPALAGEELSEQILPPTPIRRGFTVVEWGGALLN